MSWLYSLVLVEEYLGDISLDGEQSVQSNGSHIQQAYCSPDKMTDCSRLSRFGMMFKPLTEDLGEALLMSYLAAFHAKTSPQPGVAQELMANDQECGERWQGSFTKYDPDSSSWKTHQCSLLGDLIEFSETWPRWGLMRNGECWERQALAHLTDESEFGLLPTPTTNGLDGGSNSRKAFQNRFWPTPTVNGNNNIPGASKKAGWGLNSAVKMWATPCTRDWKDSGPNVNWEKLAKKKKLAGEVGGTLNPMWVEWLMGWPLGWTELKPLEMDRFQKWQEQHGKH